MLLVFAPVWSVEEAVRVQTSVYTDPCFWPQTLTGAYDIHPAGTATYVTLYKHTILGNPVHLGSIRWVRQQIQGGFFLSVSLLQVLGCNGKGRCSFICCLSF